MIRPLIICDADEVLVQFIDSLQAYLLEQGIGLSLESFAITGNVRRLATGEKLERAEVAQLIDAFFHDRIEACGPAPGAAEALAALAKRADIQVLSNVPAATQDRRAAALASYGMAYPVRSNSGPKGPVVRDLAAARQAPVVFIDDLPPHHGSVAEHAPDVFRLHMVATPRLRPLIPPSPHAHARIDDWPEALAQIEAWLDGR
jgi:hypothetical protein